jgi:hypothetical protein
VPASALGVFAVMQHAGRYRFANLVPTFHFHLFMSQVFYRTKDAQADYHFDFVRQGDGNWRIYILSQPGYGSRATGAHDTHRYHDGSRYYICWDRDIPTEAAAREVGALWADATQTYIRTGRFPTP